MTETTYALFLLAIALVSTVYANNPRRFGCVFAARELALMLRV